MSGIKFLILAAMIPGHCLAASVNISVSPSETSILLGESVFVDLIGSYDGTDKLLGGSVSLSYRADILEVIGVTLQAPSDVSGTAGSVSIAGNSGTVNDIGFASFVGVADEFRIATVEFRSLGAVGSSALTVFIPENPVYLWVNESVDDVNVSYSPGSVKVAPVPEPHAFSLLLTGVVGAGIAVRSRLFKALPRVHCPI